MLPLKIKIGVALALFLLCSNCYSANAAEYRSNVFQDGPLNCYVCNSIAECAQSAGILRKCENNAAQTCVTVFEAAGAVAQRACSDSIGQYSSYCSSNPDHCPSCSSSGCNVATSLDEYVECLSCDSAIDVDCILQPGKITTKESCYQSCMTALYPSSGSAGNFNYRLVRSCLYDRDLDDRTACLAGNDDKCVACDKANCNVDVLPATRHSCYHCDGSDECEDPSTQLCMVYKEQDKCYMRFDAETHDLVQLGCASDFDDDEAVIALIKEKSLMLCDGDNCNGFQHFPNSHECVKCSSDSNEVCATNPSFTNTYARCSTFPYTQCYQRVTSVHGGITERGCLSTLESEQFYSCLTGTDKNCKICNSNDCNKEVIPAERKKCLRCNSTKDANCNTAPTRLEYCPLYLEKDSCVAVYENGVTQRGCMTEFICDATAKNCQICEADGCNSVNLKRQVEDEVYGMFQPLPLSCNTCSGLACLTSVGTLIKCEGNLYQDCLTVFNNAGQVVRRGCETAVLADYRSQCSAQPELCFNCKSNGCNTNTNSKSYQQCLYCDATMNADCLFNPSAISATRKCPAGCVTSLYARKSDDSVQDLVRTCVDDIELEDRNNCTSANNCIQCNGTNCNKDILPTTGRLSCWHCEGDNCDEPVQQQCIGYSSSDQCYIYFDKVTHSAVRSGCKSEYTKQQIDADIKQFFLCDGDNCNSYANLPDARVCYSCDSANDENCAVAPNLVSTSERCQIHPYTDCFTRVRNDGHTQRGCLYSLGTSDFLSCQHDESGITCQVCSETGCNKELFPAIRQQCYRCNSTASADCATAPSTRGICPLYAANDNCVTKYVNGVTYRGCGTELNCDDADHTNCDTCEDDNCNTIDLSKDGIGPPGMFQELPLNCYHCGGADCAGSSAGVVKKCEGNKQQTCTVAFADDGTVAARGCSQSIDGVCSQSNTTCYDCKSNGCNLAKQQTDYVDCLFCEGKDDKDCVVDVAAVTRTRPCHKSCMTALYPRTADENPVYELIRTCLDDKDLDDRALCEEGKDDSCSACTTAKCNTVNVGDRMSCYHCSGDSCQSPQKQTCTSIVQHDQCFVQYDETGSLVEMGCKSKYDAPEIKVLITAKRLWLCDGNDCNTYDNLPVSQRCSLCNSRTDANCAIAPSAVASNTACPAVPYTQCYTRILDTGHTERGCLSSLEGDQFYNCLNGLNSTECVTCVGDNCNKQVHPEPRQSCHVCNSATSTNCTSSPAAEQICLIYAENQQCVTLIDGNGNTVRGCSKQLTCDTSDTTNCQICADDNCNKLNIKRKSDGKPGQWQSLPLTCHSCIDQEDCAISFSVETCSNKEYCMTVFDVAGTVVRRGCSDAVERDQGEYCDEHSDNCHNCNSNLCNFARSLDDYIDCIYCDSETNMHCVPHPAMIGGRRKCYKHCMTALYLRSGSSVYETSRSCLDDKDDAAQQQCINGDDEDCVACDGASCNTALLPPTRLSCYSCLGDNCESPQVGECQAYKKNDECFILFDVNNDVSRMGCISELDDRFVNSNFKYLYTCSDDNCNGFEAIPKPHACASCNSLNDPQCASEPHNIPSMKQCTILPYTDCYTLIVRDGSTSRGCVNDLITVQVRDCLSGNSTECTTCIGDRCNIEIYPADRRRCQRCNSKDDPDCESDPQSASVCPFYSTSEYCSSKLVNGNTYRGCSSEFTCDDSNYQYCRMCKDADNCNVVDLASLHIGYPGKWQDVPINCYTCVDAECQTGSGLIRKCEGNKQQNCATVFAANGTIVQRGCSNQIYAGDYADHCDANANLCKFCKSSGCNNAKALTDFTDCLFCDGSEDRNCISDVSNITHTRSCHKQCMTGLYPRTAEANPAYELSRGCLDDMDLDDREACENGNKDNCKACTGASCNKDLIPATRLHCYSCKDEDNCKSSTSYQCSAYRENDECFTQFDHSGATFEESNKVVRMGCASDLNEPELQANRRVLLLCDSDNCNREENYPDFVACKVCNSLIDPQCATAPGSIGVSAGCSELPYMGCFSRVDAANGATVRGCLSDLNDDDFDMCLSGNSTNCKICDSNDCNADIFPENRRSCYRCDSEKDTACEASPQEYGSVCPIYNEADACVTTIAGDRTYRGCTSDFTCDPRSDSTCRICDSNNCNTVNLLAGYVGAPGKWQDLPLNCFVCEGTECTSGSSLHKCESNNRQTCMTVFGADDKVERRGCSDAVKATHADYCDANWDKCMACKSSGCNNATSLDVFIDCYFCDSAESSNCSINFNTATRTRKCQQSCMVALYPRSSAVEPAYETSRSCLDDMDLDDRNACTAGEKANCKACVGNKCNTMDLPEERHECYKCQGDDCEDAKVQKCNAYKPNDQCYQLYDAYNSITLMGCRSEFEDDVVTALLKQKQLYLCDGMNCNALSTAPTPKLCSVCNSADDARCATNPNLVDNTKRCSALPYTDCFTRINEHGHTERGCLSSLEAESFYGCLTKTDGLCETCVGDKCNEIDVYPSNRLKCHQCNSATDPLCSSGPDSNMVCPVYNAYDTCVSNLRSGVTTRGCSSSMRCDNENDKHTCRLCSTSGCNTVNLEKISDDGEPGRWQDVPINCYSCVGETDCLAHGSLGVCLNNPYQNCLTIFNDADKVIQRGCSESVLVNTNAAYCEANAGKCMACNSNGCNVANSLSEYVECLACDTDANGDCVSNVNTITKTRQCYKHCMTAMYPRNEEENPSYGLTRSCYDDMDLDDRDECAAGEKEYCKVCSTAKCNADAMPTTPRLSCYTCSDESCQDPKANTCPNYRPEDKCYIEYDEQRSITAMGCRSEFSNEDADYLLRQKRLFLCEEDNCNTFDALPVPHACTLCSSRTDVQCATNPTGVSTKTTCAAVPFTDCYSRVLSDGATERGCLSNLYDDEFLGCLNGTSTTCQSCVGDSCNNQIYPSDRISCHICDSSSDSSCTASPNHLGVCPLYDEQETCITSYLNDVTRRDCSSNLVCDATNPKVCYKCSGSGCNTINLAEKQDDNYGKWQDLPLRCLSCVGDDCSSETNTQILTCEDNNQQDCVTVFDDSGKVVRRGCADAVAQDYGIYCDTNADSCYNCKSNECNTATDKSQFIECVYCDSYKSLDCIWNPLSTAHRSRKCQGGCMSALYPSVDIATNPAYDLIRTCLNDKEVDAQTTCSAGNDGNCTACATAKCNVDDLPADRHRCYICDGEDCEDPASKQCPLYKPDDQCYIWFDETNSIREMGCLSSFRNQPLENILKTKRVLVCVGDNCNTLDKIPTPQKCAVCNSTDNVYCATNALEVGTFEVCSQMPYTDCYSKLASDGSTARGCLSDLPGDDFVSCLLGNDTNCAICTGDGCNREVFPADRQQCYTCTSEDDATCESFPTRMLACPIVNDSESCKTSLSNNVTVRGCSSEVYCDANDSSTCRSCHSTGCNSIDLLNKENDGNHGLWQSLPLRCHTCEGAHCRSSLGPAITCTNNVDQDCMTVFNATGDIIRRGCEDAVEDYEDLYCRENPELCFKCKSNECNAAWSLSDYVECVYCNSATDPLCAMFPTNAEFASRSCYQECMVAMKNQDVIRSCLDDKELYVQYVCRSDQNGKDCASCNTNNCNRFVYPKDRLSCHVCTSSSCSSTVAQYCQYYEGNDYCFAKYDSGQLDLMGCASSQNLSDIVAWTQQRQIYSCEGPNCNEPSKLPQEIVCVSCDSSKTPSCAQNPSTVSTTEICAPPNNECVVNINTAGHTVRGCASSLSQVEQTSCVQGGKCSICDGTKCNGAVFPTNRRKCHICDSLADGNCVKSPDNVAICPVYAINDRCITKNTDNFIQRGCTTELTCDTNDPAHCQICDSDNCNTVDLSDAAVLATGSLLFTLLLAFVATIALKRH